MSFISIWYAAWAALNAGLYVADPNPWSAGGFVFCALGTLVCEARR